MEQKCPRCGAAAQELIPVDTALKVALKATGESSGPLPAFVCSGCHSELSGQVSQGMRLRMEEEQKEKNRLMLWKNRVSLIKQGRQLMSSKAYSEAAVAYEKYLRVLEMVYNLQSGQLTPEVFNNSKRSKELTVIASVYWDLVRIYDTSPKYGDRMAKAAAKLAAFLPFSTIYPDVIKKAESFSRSAKNPQVIKNFLRACKVGRRGCFIATAAYGHSESEGQVMLLRLYREQVLKQSAWGRSFVKTYYHFSPAIAGWLQNRPWAKVIFRQLLRPAVFVAKKHLNSRVA